MKLEHLPTCHDLSTLLANIDQVVPLLDAIPNTVFFIKDLEARYVLVNQTLVQRLGAKNKDALLGFTADDIQLFRFGRCYAVQDRQVLESGKSINDRLELHLYPDGQSGWCLTHKIALRDTQQRVIGMTGISYDLQVPESDHPAYRKIAAVDAHIREHYSNPIKLDELTRIAGLSIAQLERHCKGIFHLTPRQMIHKARLGAASHLLAARMPLDEVARSCGYTDHSAFSRQFKALTGLSPSQYRESCRIGVTSCRASRSH